MSEPRMAVRTWIAATVTIADQVSAPIDMANAAIVAIATPAAVHVATFWLQVQIGGAWYTLARLDGTALDFCLMSSRVVPMPPGYTLPYTSARLAMPAILHDYTFQVCVETNPA